MTAAVVVSIPYRYGITSTHSGNIVMCCWRIVSIPYRYGITFIQIITVHMLFKFQFLIGTVLPTLI